ncbi:MAG TPA: prephenate dehydrogenase [Spirochaetia bacterium]|nr:prephenate dehydrogenase [Spirochaetia bacterium]
MGRQGNKPLFERAAIVGVGLIGGSLALAMKERGVAGTVTGHDSDPAALREACDLGVLDRAEDCAGAAVRGADLVVVATPVGYTCAVLRELAPYLTPGVLVTDVGSTKAATVEAARHLVPGGWFVGGHPMAGSERGGVAAANPYLFENAYYLLTPTGETAPAALAAAQDMVRALGARTVILDPGEHDQLVALISHLPHLVAAALVNTAASSSRAGRALPLAAGGFRDTTRIASGPPAVWRDIFLSNRQAVGAALRIFREQLDLLQRAVAGADPDTTLELLTLARETRESLPEHGRDYLPVQYEVLVTVPDRPGSIAYVSNILFEAGLNITDIEILRVREDNGGTMRLGFDSEEAQGSAVEVLENYGITARKARSRG